MNYSILLEIPEVGSTVQLYGQQHGKATLVAHNPNTSTLVIHFKGYGENPGSRHSMLYSYYPAHTVVYSYRPHDHYDAHQLHRLVEWETNPRRVKS